MKYILSLLFVVLALVSYAQDIEKEIGFKYVKAEYLMSTERMEDAIKELNDIVKLDPLYKDALILRAETRFRLGAFVGAKKDIMLSIDNAGITLRAAELLGRAESAMGNDDAAFNSLTAAVLMGSDDMKVYEIRAELSDEKGMKIQACEDWSKAAELGSTSAAIKLRKNCGTFTSPKKTKKNPPVESDSIPTDTGSTTSETKNDVPVFKNPPKRNTSEVDTNAVEIDTSSEVEDDPVYEEEDLLIPEEDNTENRIVIDEDLTLSIFGQGIGKRTILDRPSILILSEESGKVTVEICINENGKVDYAEYVPAQSTITKNSLVSLAIRKSKEFWFEKSDYPKQCGFIVFEITGSE